MRHIDLLLKRNPGDLALKKRKANILVRMHLGKSKVKPKVEDNTPSRYLDAKRKKGKKK